MILYACAKFKPSYLLAGSKAKLEEYQWSREPRDHLKVT